VTSVNEHGFFGRLVFVAAAEKLEIPVVLVRDIGNRLPLLPDTPARSNDHIVT
jgi:hypothetical protein